MKKGSGNLDFGGSDDQSEADESEPPVADPNDTEQDSSQGQSTTPSDPVDTESNPTDDSGPATQEFPYFVRRSNVGDEREERIEIHLRPEVNNQESEFRNALADELDTGEVSKTDAREFALKFAYANPEEVAEMMRDEGYGLTD